MVWSVVVQSERHRNDANGGHQNRRTTVVTTKQKKKKKNNGWFPFFFLFGVFHWVKRNKHSFTAKRPINAQKCSSHSSNPGLSMAKTPSL